MSAEQRAQRAQRANRARRRAPGKKGAKRPPDKKEPDEDGVEQGGGDTNDTVTVSLGSLGQLEVMLLVPDGKPVSFKITRTDTSVTVTIPPDETAEEEVSQEVEVSSDGEEEPLPDADLASRTSSPGHILHNYTDHNKGQNPHIDVRPDHTLHKG